MGMLIIFVISVLLGFGCQDSAGRPGPSISTDTRSLLAHGSVLPDTLMTRQMAERILGEPAHLADSSKTFLNDTLEYKLTFIADSPDAGSGKTGNLYFMFEQYAKHAIAKKIYDDIREGNRRSEGFKDLNGLGDQAYFHSDDENFYFIIARKKEKMIRMKINKVTRNTSLAAFNQAAKDIIARL